MENERILYEYTNIVPKGQIWFSDGERLYKVTLPTGFGEVRAIALPKRNDLKDFDWREPRPFFENDPEKPCL